MRELLHATWAAAAPGWEANAAYVDQRGAGVAAAMLELAGPAAGERVLELGCGPGSVGLAAAARVGPTGVVVLTDVAREMTAIAAARARQRGIKNVVTRERDLEQVDEPDGCYDVVLCREALMLVPDPARAVREIRRVLRPGGRAAVAVWGAPASNPWLSTLFDAVASATGIRLPPPGAPGPFSLADPAELATLLGAELNDVSVRAVDSPVRVASFGDWWAVVPMLAGPVAQLLPSLSDGQQQDIRCTAERALAGYVTADGYDIPGLSLVAGGRAA
jgi:SAM-dependent methyltransferase